MYKADLHPHSRFARACSKELNLPNMAKWAKRKGIDLLGSGDILHPVWRAEVKSLLQEIGNGLYRFEDVKFTLSCEVSSIYSDKGRLRRIHLMVLLPSFASVEKIYSELIKRGVNLGSDGRPITGISAHDLTEIFLSIERKAVIIPAHIWTPHFGVLGAASGYDFLEECFRDLSDNIFAVETGLSSDPLMNWRVANLDKKTLVSFSDAHSLPNLGRELTIFKGGLSFDELRDDLIKQNIAGTLEFFPEEGMYHYSGHRDCQVSFSPEEIKQKGRTCPVCGKPLTNGVLQRVEDLASRDVEDIKVVSEDGVIKSAVFPDRPQYRMLVGLEKIIAETLSVGKGSKKVRLEYEKLVDFFAPEIDILTEIPLSKIESWSGLKVAEGVKRVREGKVKIEPGYDGRYGVIKIWE